MTYIYIAGENIYSGSAISVSPDRKIYAKTSRADHIWIGNAAEDLRKGFRVIVIDGLAREDDNPPIMGM